MSSKVTSQRERHKNGARDAGGPTGPAGAAEALARLHEFFRDRQTRPGVLARRLLGRPHKDDAQLVEHLVSERRRKTRLNGSTDGSLVKTAWTAWELLDLDYPPDHAGVVRTVGYVLTQQDKPGHFGEGCDDARHERKLCRHFLGGFFSAGTADEDVAPLTFPSGVTVTDEAAARFAASCFALRTALRAGEDRRQSVIRHLDSLLQLWDGGAEFARGGQLDLAFFGLGALALAPLAYRQRLDALLAGVLARQQPAGAWPDAALFHALDMLLPAPSSAARDALRRAAPLLISMQGPGGAFDQQGHDEKALIGLRVLQLATGG